MHSLESYCRRQRTEILDSILREYFTGNAPYATEDILLILSILLERDPGNADYHAAWFALADEDTFQP